MMKKFKRNTYRLFFALLGFTTTSCMVGPNYHTPKVAVSENYTESPLDAKENSSLQDWWTTFNDEKLNSLIEIGIKNNYNLKIAIEKIEQARSFYRLKRADLFPEINMNAAAIRQKLSRNEAISSYIPLTIYNNFQIGFDALWEIDIFGKIRREKQSALFSMQSKQENMRNVYISLLSEISKNHMDLIALNQTIKLEEEKIQLQQTIYNLTKDLKQTGIDSSIAEENELASLKLSQARIKAYQTLFKQTAYRLAYLLGMQPEKIQIQEYNELTLPDATQKIQPGMPSTLLQNRPDIRMAERNLAQATAQVGSAIADFFPRFSLTGDSLYDSKTLNNLFEKNSFNWSLGSFLKWPIIHFGRIRANVDVQKSIQKQALLTYENTIIEALQDVEGALVAYYNEKIKLSEIEQEVTAIEKSTTLLHDQYASGLISYPKYLKQKKILLDTQLQEIDSKRNLLNNLIAVYKVLGGSNWENCQK